MVTKKINNSYAKGGRVKANTIKAGVTKNRSRKYSCGGKLKTK
jgi:hypothetical protein